MKHAGGTDSVAEAVFWSALVQARVGMPCEFRMQWPLILEDCRTIPDFYWPEAKIIAETTTASRLCMLRITRTW